MRVKNEIAWQCDLLIARFKNSDTAALEYMVIRYWGRILSRVYLISSKRGKVTKG